MRDSAARKWLFPIATGAVGLAIGLSMTGVRAPQDRASQQSFHGGDTPHTNLASPFSTPSEWDAHETGMPSSAVARDLLIDSQAEDALASDEARAGFEHGDNLSAATQEAIALVDAAISRGQWTANDAAFLRTEFHALSHEQKRELLRALVLAVNQERLTVETERFPF